MATRSDFAVVPTEGFNPEKIKSLQTGMEHPLGRNVLSAAILDRDFRSKCECETIKTSLEEKCDFAIIHTRKEIENFVLVPSAINRLVMAKLHARRNLENNRENEFHPCAESILLSYAAGQKTYLMSQFTDTFKKFERGRGFKGQDATLLKNALDEFEDRWSIPQEQLRMIGGKNALSHLNGELQKRFKVSVTPLGIIESMRSDEIPLGVREMVTAIASFIRKDPPR